ncbi:MAG: lipoate--protein ligase family protein [Candidatus Thermoplasmatota archaeon]|nr:lipoate--protein ligase family protein [Candidatus Thermoplasmatota archaeon]MBU4255713.1 lipoate--protein ligase family protein [Candidatus Thermoplasmatota archaeon]MCG2825768.1 lipoate--protein ligase family protein [Thermoplasmatales archaeon]
MEQRNGILSADYKVKGGKLLRCSLRMDNHVISSIKITGDFFMYPEEKIESLEEMLTGVEMNEASVIEKINDFFNSNVQVVGADAEDFVKLVMSASAD